MSGKLQRIGRRLFVAYRKDGLAGARSVFIDGWGNLRGKFWQGWRYFWMRSADCGWWGRLAIRFASWQVPGYKGRQALARLTPNAYISPSAIIHHSDVRLGAHVFIGDRVVIYQAGGGGPVELGEDVHLHNDINVEVGAGGSVAIGARTHVQPRCQLTAFAAPIRIGSDVEIAPNCAFYPYDHGVEPDKLISMQPLATKGPIIVGDGVWLGFGVIVLSGVRIGKGAVIGAGSVVARDIPEGAIAVGSPARVVKLRNQIAEQRE